MTDTDIYNRSEKYMDSNFEGYGDRRLKNSGRAILYINIKSSCIKMNNPFWNIR